MINKIKSLFLLALCVAFIGAAASGVSAQNRIGADKVLAAGKKPLLQSDVETLIEFHEWIFDTDFTRDERRTFQSFIVDEFRGNAAATRRNADEVIKTMRQIRALDADKQRRVREMTISDYLKDLRATGDDADSQFLLGIYKRGQNGGNKGKVREVLPSEEDLREAENPSTNRGVGSGAGSPKLVGKWKRSVGAGRGDDGTGKTTYESGTSYTFEFFADGTMHFLSEMKVLSIVQCRVTETTKIPGTYSVSGDEVTMNLGTGTTVGTSSCETKGNFKKTLSASPLTKKFDVKNLDSVFRPDAPLILCFDGGEGDACYEKSSR